jgi:hypothetical protein
MVNAEVMTTANIAALDYGGNLEKARKMLQKQATSHTCSAKAASTVAGMLMGNCS